MTDILLVAPKWLSTTWSVIQAILVLLFMVTIHEFGHYMAGKKLGFKINEFAIGFGPAIFKRKMKGGEDFSLRIFPLGGFCAFEGEDEESSSDKSFEKQKPWKRIIVLVAGAFMNFVVTLLIVILTYTISGQYVFQVGGVLENAPTESAPIEYMLQKDDIILKVNGKNIVLSSDLTNAIKKAEETPDKLVNVEVLRGGERQEVKVKIRNYVVDTKDENGNVVTVENQGFGILQSATIYRFGFFQSIGNAFIYCFKMAGEVLGILGQLFTGKLALSSLGGPITTITITAEMASYGFRQLLEIVALIGVNLAVFNLLPIPALDGSKIVFTVIEWIRGKPINRKVENIIHFCGFIFLIGFAILVDLLKVL